MGAHSKFDQHFSPKEQAKIAAYLDENPKMTAEDFRDLLAERGLTVSTATAWKEKRKVEDLLMSIRRTNRSMDALAERMEGEDTSKQGKALLYMFQTLIYDVQEKLLTNSANDEDLNLDPRLMSFLGRSLADLTRANRMNQDFAEREKKIRQEERQKAAGAVKKASKGIGKGVMAIIDICMVGMRIKDDGTVTLTKEEVDSLRESFFEREAQHG